MVFQFESGSNNTILTGYVGSGGAVVIPDGVVRIKSRSPGGALSNGMQANDSITSVTFPSSLTTIDDSSFYLSPNINTVNFSSNSSLRTIGEQAFAGCGLTNVSIPEGVTTIGQKVFFL